MKSEGEFSVWRFFPDDTYDSACRFVDAETAVTTAKRVTDSPAAKLGVVVRVIITDGGDFTCFEWRAGEGVTFPPRGTERRAR
jgi:hypothetical protein